MLDVDNKHLLTFFKLALTMCILETITCYLQAFTGLYEYLSSTIFIYQCLFIKQWLSTGPSTVTNQEAVKDMVY